MVRAAAVGFSSVRVCSNKDTRCLLRAGARLCAVLAARKTVTFVKTSTVMCLQYCAHNNTACVAMLFTAWRSPYNFVPPRWHAQCRLYHICTTRQRARSLLPPNRLPAIAAAARDPGTPRRAGRAESWPAEVLPRLVFRVINLPFLVLKTILGVPIFVIGLVVRCVLFVRMITVSVGGA